MGHGRFDLFSPIKKRWGTGNSRCTLKTAVGLDSDLSPSSHRTIGDTMKPPEVPMFAFTRISLARQYLLVSFLILFCGMLIIGAWVGRQIEIGVTHRIAAVTALYVDSLISHHLQYLMDTDVSNDYHEAEIDAFLTTTPIGQRIVAYKIWGADGRIIYS